MLAFLFLTLQVAAAASWTASASRPVPSTASSRTAAVHATAADPTVLKDSLLSIVAGGEVDQDSTQQQELAELVLGLSAINPTPSPARSKLINGVWEVVYSQMPGGGLLDSPTRPIALSLYATGFSPAVLASGLAKLPFDAASIGPVRVTIRSADAGQPRITTETKVSVFGAEQPLQLRANLLTRSDVCMREEFVEATLLGQRSLLPGPLAYSRSLYITYLDEELLVMRDDGGLANVLKRGDLFPGAGEPSFGDDDAAPGAASL